jgi:hypothetical protein
VVEDEADERLPVEVGSIVDDLDLQGGEHKGTWPVMRIDSEKTSRIFAHNILVNSSSTSFKSDSMVCN